MSEYYERRRAITADATSFGFFVLGFLAGGVIGWPVLRASFENGAPDRGLAIFIAWIFGGGLAAGVCGYMIGTVAGRLWQAWHQSRRARRAKSAPGGQVALSVDSSPDTPVATASAQPRHAPGPMSCRVGPLAPSIYAVFARRAAGDAEDRRYVETATTEIQTLAAWDGLDVAGVARLLSDGYGALYITDFAVDPHYAAADVENTLIDFAKRRLPAGGRLTRV